MGIAFLILLVIVVLAFLYKKLSKKIFMIIISVLVIIVVSIMIIDKFDVVNKIEYEIYKNQRTITQEEREQAIAEIGYTNIQGIDAMYFETCYIYKTDNSYSFLITEGNVTIAGPQEEKITKQGTISNKKQLKKLIDDFNKKVKSSSKDEYVSISYQGQEIKKDELLSKLFEQ